MKDKMLQEWKSYEDEVIAEDVFVESKGQNDDGTAFINYRRIDDYWYRVLQITDSRGQPKYSSLGVVVKVALSLSHGQADVERGFSLNKQVLADRSVLSEHLLCGTVHAHSKTLLQNTVQSSTSLLPKPCCLNIGRHTVNIKLL